MMICDTIVVGAGVEGSAAAYQLVKDGVQNIVLLEQFDRWHAQGSSCGLSRITRMSYKKPFYIPMMSEAFKLWSDLENSSGVTLYKQTGYLEFGPSEHRDLNVTIDCLRVNNIPHKIFFGTEANWKYPRQLKLPQTCKCIYEDFGGILYAQNALMAFQQEFLKQGGTLLEHHRVTEIIPGDVVTVVTNRGTFKARNVVIAAGPWAPALCSSIGVHLPFEVVRIEVLYWKVQDPAAFSSDVFPVIHCYDKGDAFFGVPAEEYPDMIKLCVGTGTPVNPDNRDTNPSIFSVTRVSEYISSTFKGVANKPSIIKHCLYTKSPDYDPVIDKHPHYDNIIIAAGFTGHGFKLSPLFGQLIAELITGKKPSHDLHPFRLARFLTNKSHL